uniref:hypothetical protein n=1 Tax=Salmonella enterica TaxID=28901 RepID=UPI003523F00B
KLGSLSSGIVGETTLKRAGELLTEVAKKAGTDATVFGLLGTAGQNKINKAFGVAESDDYLKSALTYGIIGTLFGLKEGVGKVFKSKISAKTKDEIDYISSYLPDNLVRSDIDKLVKDGK